MEEAEEIRIGMPVFLSLDVMESVVLAADEPKDPWIGLYLVKETVEEAPRDVQ